MQAILDEILANANVNVGLAFSLTTELDSVLAFINEIEGLIQAGRLSSTDGQLLIDAAQSMIDQLKRIAAPN